MQPCRRRRVNMQVLAVLLVLPVLAGSESTFGAGFTGDDPGIGLFSGSTAGDKQKAKDSFRQNNFGLAERSFTAVLKRDPTDAEAWVGLAASYDRLGRFDLAD